jgi:serine/threonine-protein kinase
VDVTIGELVDKKYRIVRLLGEGGMGAVYEGENVRVHNRVAIKVLHAGIATNQAAVDRFEREAQAAGRIGSDHIVEVYDLGDLPSGARYMVMEYLDGESLSARVTKESRMAPVAIGAVMMQLLEGLAAAHKAGIIHRDLKPDNIFLMKTKGGGDFVKIVDFGVSKFNAMSGDSQMSMTRTGAVIGTPYYMSPEQARGAKESDHRSDLYSAGVVMFECVTGQVPFLADTFNELMFKIVLEPPPDPEKLVPGLDAEFAAIIRKGMAREPAHRYQSAEEFGQAIANWMAVVAPASSLPTITGRGAFGSSPDIRLGSQPDLGRVPSSPDVSVHARTPDPNAQLGGTANALASSTSNTATTGKSNAGVAIAAAMVLLMLGGGGAAFLLKGRSSATAETPSAASSAAELAKTADKPADVKPPPPEAPVEPVRAAVPEPGDTEIATAVTADAGATAATRHTTGSTVAAETPKPARGHSASAGNGKNGTSSDPKSNTIEIKGRSVTTEL